MPLEAVICTVSASGTERMNELVRESARKLADLKSRSSGKYQITGYHIGEKEDGLNRELIDLYEGNLTIIEGKTLNPWKASRIISQSIKSNIRYALQKEAECILTSEGDKPDLVEEFPKIVDKLLTQEAGVVLPVRSRKGFAQFPKVQKVFEDVVNHHVGEIIGVRTDYTYGPRAFNPRSAGLALDYEKENWGVLTYPVVGAHMLRQKLEIVNVRGAPQVGYMEKYPFVMRNVFAQMTWRAIQNWPHIQAANAARKKYMYW